MIFLTRQKEKPIQLDKSFDDDYIYQLNLQNIVTDYKPIPSIVLFTWFSSFTINNAHNVQTFLLYTVTDAVLKLDVLSLNKASFLGSRDMFMKMFCKHTYSAADEWVGETIR